MLTKEWINKPKSWLNDVKAKRKEYEPKSELYYDEKIVLEGIDVDKGYFKVYQLKDGTYMVRLEE